ncbi:MAG: hypothetical protein HFG64_00455 [Lachnospiraceae bacterium]|nr:hypothetical protein [Lachnospiraceae bacterium]
MEVIRAYPEFRELYQEVFLFRSQKKELISMYSEALLILDANTVQHMVEEQKKEILELKGDLADTSKALESTSKDLEMERKASLAKDKEIERLHALLDAQKNVFAAHFFILFAACLNCYTQFR